MVIIIYLAIILSSVTQSAATKLFNRRSSNSSVFNAIKAMTSFALFVLMAAGGFSFHLPTLLFGLLYGICLCLSMYAGYKALCLGQLALTSMLVSFSVVIPLLWGLTVGDETLGPIRSVALILLFGSIILTNCDKLNRVPTHAAGPDPSPKSDTRGLWFAFVGLTFLCNGFCSVLQKQHQTLYPEAYNGEFMLFAMLLCTFIFSAVALRRESFAHIKAAKGKWLGVLSGTANGLANYLTLALSGFEDATILFPIISAGTLLGAVLCGRYLFKEKLKLNHYLAILLGMLAVILLKL